MLVFAITANFWQVVTFDMTLTHFSSILSVAVSYKLHTYYISITVLTNHKHAA